MCNVVGLEREIWTWEAGDHSFEIYLKGCSGTHTVSHLISPHLDDGYLFLNVLKYTLLKFLPLRSI